MATSIPSGSRQSHLASAGPSTPGSASASTSVSGKPAGKYVPPARRSQASAIGSSSSSQRSPYVTGYPQPQPQARWGEPRGSWQQSYAGSSRSPIGSNGHGNGNGYANQSNTYQSHSAPVPTSGRTPYIPRQSAGSGWNDTSSSSGLGHEARSAPTGYRTYKPESAHLFLAGDSFVGALNPAKGPPPEEDTPETEGETEDERAEYIRIKKLWAEYDAIPKMIKIKKEKGAAAKGLNNPNSKKNISSSVLYHGLSTYSDRYHDYNKTAKFFMMMFGNVDLNINYLWQLVNRDISRDSFSQIELSSCSSITDFSAFNSHRRRRKGEGDETASADHTDNDHTNLALGPERFVSKVIREYTSFIEREIVNGAIGAKLQGYADAANDIHARGVERSRNRVLLAGALPPMVQDKYLYRILGKYVDQHVEAKALASSGEKDTLKRGLLPKEDRGAGEGMDARKPDALEEEDSSGSRTPSPITPSGTDRRSNQATDPDALADSIASVLTLPGADSEALLEQERLAEEESKSTFKDLLSLQPGVCTLSIRTAMIKDFNTQLRSFCEKYPEVLAYVGINEAMESEHPDPAVSDERGGTPESEAGEGGKGIEVLKYYCSQVEGDGANVHPTWERTYPLWLDVLRNVGVDVDTFPEVDLEGTEAAWTAEKGARLERSRYKT